MQDLEYLRDARFRQKGHSHKEQIAEGEAPRSNRSRMAATINMSLWLTSKVSSKGTSRARDREGIVSRSSYEGKVKCRAHRNSAKAHKNSPPESVFGGGETAIQGMKLTTWQSNLAVESRMPFGALS